MENAKDTTGGSPVPPEKITATAPEETKPADVMIAEVPPTPKPNSNEEKISALGVLQVSRGWILILTILDDNIKYLEKLILEKFDPITKRELSAKEIEEARLKRLLTIELRNTPQNYVAKLQEIPVEEDKEPDPYFKTKEEIDKSNDEDHKPAP